MSRKRECPSCASMVPAEPRQCFICGYEFPGGIGRWSWRAWVAVILLVLFLIPLIRMLVRLLG